MKKVISVTWGEETFTPVPYQTFKVGPFTAQFEVDDRGDELEAMNIAYAKLRAFAERVRKEKYEEFMKQVAAKGGR